ncbi:hypothetical protein [Pseudoalteromonas marina]|uniref:Uncharacterized protein n=1 Tax=Pseudoalteromonas marina TaxID=267375 RepID=A0ABT9FI80_9GAMM|nr:hypothetical protein [Pseudoalteromonas marina]MDP2566448.1 hypothetical protein [Pseudoalteromonas marina]
MKNDKQRSDAAYSAVLAHTNYASIPSDADIETKIKETLKGLRILSEEYGVDFDKDSLIDKSKPTCPGCLADLTAENSVIRDYINKSDDDEAEDISAYGHYEGEDQAFESDSFSGFGGGNYDLLDDSDKCGSCNTQL